MQPGQRVGGRPRTFAEQDQIMADFHWPDLEPFHAAMAELVPGWSEQSTRMTVYGGMLALGCTAREAVAHLMTDIEGKAMVDDDRG